MSNRRRIHEALGALLEHRHRPRPVTGATPGRSLVAGVNATFREYEAYRPPELRILEDPWAHLFAERHPLVVGLRALRFVAPPLERELQQLSTAHCTRHCSLDTLIGQAVDEGFTQIVIIGAGYDMRASRFPRDGVRWFEVDLPDTANRKWARLEGRADVNRAVVRVPSDLIAQGLAGALEAAPIDLAVPTCFVLEGLLHYLSPAVIDATIEAMAAGTARRRVLLSFIDPQMMPRASSLFVTLVKAVREAPREYLSPEALAARFAARGLPMTGHWDFAAQAAAFAPAALRRPVRLSQDVARFDRAAPPSPP